MNRGKQILRLNRPAAKTAKDIIRGVTTIRAG
jgi:hypothetical protein